MSTNLQNLDAIRSASNILEIIGAHVKLRKEGREYVGCCPFHEEKTASFKVDPEKNGGCYICFGCGASGDVFRFVSMAEGLSFKDAAKRVAELSGYVETAPLKNTKNKEDSRDIGKKQAESAPSRRTLKPDPSQLGPITAVYAYLNETGDCLFEVCRYEPGANGRKKDFKCRVPVPGGYVYSMDGVRRVLYRLPNVLAASEVWVTEGEKDVHSLESLGLVATTNPHGARKWRDEYSESLRGKDVIIVPDNGAAGEAHRDLVQKSLTGHADRVTTVILPDSCKDVTDFIEAGNSVHDLRALVEQARSQPNPEPQPDPFIGLLRTAIESHDPRKVIELAPLIARLESVQHANAMTEIYNSFGKELNRTIFMQVIRSERRKAAQEERSHLVQATGTDWAQNLIQQENGAPKPLLANAITAFQECPEWAGVLAYNEFTSTVVLQQKPPLDIEWAAFQPWTDQHDRLAAEWLQANRITVNVETAGQAVQTVARKTGIHPVRDYLNSLQWDGQQRIDRWVFRYLGVIPDEARHYAAAVGKRFLISAVARIFHPGCKADCAVILEGEQGIRKSTALKALAGEWFTDEIADFGSKDAALQMQGAWIIELAELDSLRRADVARIKAFMSRTNDRFRPPYGRHVVEYRRQCVFAGSVNDQAYLQDETGNRRFWPLRCGEIKIDELRSDRDQLWAEAVHCFRAGDNWWLDTPELIAQAKEEQQSRMAVDPWEDLISKWLEERVSGGRVTTMQVLEQAIGKKFDQWNRFDQHRIGNCLLNLGFQRKREVRNGQNPRRWYYERPL